VVTRDALQELLSRRLHLLLVLASLLVPLGSAILIYVRYNLPLLEALDMDSAGLIAVDETFFLYLMSIQGLCAVLVTAFLAPGLIARDMRENGLALYFARPLSRSEYLLGKLSILSVVLSVITWVPVLLLFALTVSLEAQGWWLAHVRVVPAVFFGSWLWILFLSIVGLAASAWLKWRVVASGALILGYFVLSALGRTFAALLRMEWGRLFDLGVAVRRIWRAFLDLEDPSGLSLWGASFVLGLILLLAFVALSRRVRAYRVVR
jgi:ABC-2 type transport system permease protein